MTDDISKVYAALRSIRYNANNGSQDRPLHHRLSLIANEADKAIAAIESAAAPVEVELPEPVDTLALEDGFNVIGEQAVFTADQMREYARAYAATLARQLAEAKERIESLTTANELLTASVESRGARYQQAESQLAEATRRLGEVRPIMDELVQCANVGRWDGKLIRAAQDWLAALTKEPTK